MEIEKKDSIDWLVQFQVNYDLYLTCILDKFNLFTFIFKIFV